jgi:hypothetical protein
LAGDLYAYVQHDGHLRPPESTSVPRNIASYDDDQNASVTFATRRRTAIPRLPPGAIRRWRFLGVRTASGN